MWPWEHLAFGYVLYSILARVSWRESPGDLDAVALAAATQLPDLIDKPLSWGLDLTATGYGPAHSVLVGGPLAVIAGVLAARRGRVRAGAAFVFGYASHLFADFLALRAGGPSPGRLLWPVAPRTPYAVDRGLVGRFSHYFGEFVAAAANPEFLGLFVAYAGVFVLVAGVWVYDGAPGLAAPLRWAFGSDSTGAR